MTGVFSKRSDQSEWMDTQIVSFEEFEHCLSDLEKINNWTFAYYPTLQWLHKKLSALPSPQEVSIMDIGSGGGDMLRKIWKRFKNRFRLHLQGIDLNPWSKATALKRTDEKISAHYETSDIFVLEPDRRADFIISSLFTHHLTDVEIIRFLQWMEAHANRGWFINDLHRHPLPYYFIKYAVRLLGYNRLVKHDAPVSVMRAFSRKDWGRLLAAAQIPSDSVVIRWYLPFRYGIARSKS